MCLLARAWAVVIDTVTPSSLEVPAVAELNTTNDILFESLPVNGRRREPKKVQPKPEAPPKTQETSYKSTAVKSEKTDRIVGRLGKEPDIDRRYEKYRSELLNMAHRRDRGGYDQLLSEAKDLFVGMDVQIPPFDIPVEIRKMPRAGSFKEQFLAFTRSPPDGD